MTSLKLPLTDQINTALVYDRVNTSFGGAEQVLLALKQLLPQADLLTSVYHRQQASWAHNFKVKTSFLQHLPGAKTHHRWYLPLMPAAFSSLDTSPYQLIISVTSAEAKAIKTRPDQIHICYLLTPPRYLYSHQKQYLASRSWLQLPGIKTLSQFLLQQLKQQDQRAINNPDLIIPLSQLVKKRIKKYYQQQLPLPLHAPIYPPVDVNLQPTQMRPLATTPVPDNFALSVARLVTYKRLDLALRACHQLDLPLIIVGTGPESKRLKHLRAQLQAKTIFLGEQPQPVVNWLLQAASIFVAPGIDDFGLAPLQANYFGTPAIVNAQSGVAEVLLDQQHGLHLDQPKLSTLTTALKTTLSMNFNSQQLSAHARQYQTNRFLLKFKNVIQTIVAKGK